MTQLDKVTFDRIIALLAPKMTTQGAREAFVTQAFFDAPSLLQRIDYSGNAHDFTIQLVNQALQYSDIDTGEPALVALLQHLHQQVGVNVKSELAQLIASIQQMRDTAPETGKRMERFEQRLTETSAKLTQTQPGRRSRALRKQRLQEQLAQYEREYTIAKQQAEVELSDIYRDRLNSLMDQIEVKIDEVWDEIETLA